MVSEVLVYMFWKIVYVEVGEKMVELCKILVLIYECG